MCFLYSQTPVTAFLSLTKFDIAKRSGKENMCFWCWNERRRKKPLQVHFLDLVVFIFEKWGVKSILPSFLSLQHLISFVKTKKKELWSCRKLNHFFFHKSLKQRRCLYSHSRGWSLASNSRYKIETLVIGMTEKSVQHGKHLLLNFFFSNNEFDNPGYFSLLRCMSPMLEMAVHLGAVTRFKMF